MRTRYGVSPWIHRCADATRPAFPVARGTVATDVVIIGGGLTGSAVAHACATAGLTTVVLEAARVGHGTTGRTAGLLLPEPGAAFRDVSAAHGLRAARTIFEAWRTAAHEAADVLRRARVRGGLEPQHALVVTGREGEAALRREHDARQAAGLGATWLADAQARRQSKLDVAAGMRTADGCALDPYQTCVGLLAAAPRRKLQVFERSPAARVTVGTDGVEVSTGSATVTATTVVVATGSATAEFAALRRHFKRRERHLVMTAPLTAAMAKGVTPQGVLVSDAQGMSPRIQWTADGRLVLRGGEQDETPERTRDAVRIQRTGQLMYELLLRCPAISGLQPEYGWDVPFGRAADGLPYIGAHRNYPRHLFALGGDGDSLTGAFLAARVLLRALTATPDRADAVFSWTR